jgi:hypothetical protein
LPPSPAAKPAAWWRRLFRLPNPETPSDAILSDVERPWRSRWDHLPRRDPGPNLSMAERRQAHVRAREVARLTLGDALWTRCRREGYLDLRSGTFPGLTYRLRVGLRIEVRCDAGVTSPWPYPYLCINPKYPLPEEEFFAQLYLYVRDREDIVIRVAAPQPWDQTLGRTF